MRGWLFIGRGKGTIFLPENEEIQLKSSPLILHFAKAVDTVVPEIPKMNLRKKLEYYACLLEDTDSPLITTLRIKISLTAVRNPHAVRKASQYLRLYY